MNSKIRIYLSLVGDIVASLLLGFLCVSFLATGMVHPVLKHDQQLLKALGLESFFPTLLLLLLLISLLLTIFIYHKFINGLLKKLNYQSELSIPFITTWLKLGPLWIVTSVTVFYAIESFFKWLVFSDLFITSTVISNILLYLLAGYALGQTSLKLAKIFLWEHRNSKRIFLDLNGKLYAVRR